MFVAKEFTFDASHFLPNYHGKCEHLHGHTYKLVVTVEGKIGEDGLVVDFAQLKRLVDEHVIEHLDHHHLNDIIPNPSAENIVIWIWDRITQALKETQNGLYSSEIKISSGVKLYEVSVWETPTSSAIYRGH